MSRREIIDVWPSEDRPEYAVRADRATVEQGRRAVARQYPNKLSVRYVGDRVVNLPEDDEHRGRRRRAHIYTDVPA